MEPCVDRDLAPEACSLAIGLDKGVLCGIGGDCRIAADPEDRPVQRMIGALVEAREVVELGAKRHL